jgi:phosphoenolpyruvate---glycerone phosphotransferase subunit DhaK
VKKLINDPFDVVEESLEGFLLAHEDVVKRVGRRAIARVDAPIAGKAGVVIGGGSGHLPAFMGYVGPGGADAAPIGNIFASPPAKPVLEATLAADGGVGVVYSYGNYAGDVMNFDRAAARARAEHGIEVETVLVTDDVASAPSHEIGRRRGIAGDFFVFKVLAAKAETMADLASVVATARRANDNTRTVGVGLSACTVPANGKPTFHLAEDELEVGLGVHGEPGIRRTTIEPVDALVDEILGLILADKDFAGSDVAILVNGLGATPYEELYIMYRRARQVLGAQGVHVRRSYVGEYITSLEMAGASITLMQLDEELHDLLAAPAQCPMFVQMGARHG